MLSISGPRKSYCTVYYSKLRTWNTFSAHINSKSRQTSHVSHSQNRLHKLNGTTGLCIQMLKRSEETLQYSTDVKIVSQFDGLRLISPFSTRRPLSRCRHYLSAYVNHKTNARHRRRRRPPRPYRRVRSFKAISSHKPRERKETKQEKRRISGQLACAQGRAPPHVPALGKRSVRQRNDDDLRDQDSTSALASGQKV